MDMNKFAEQSMLAAKKVTGTDGKDTETQEIAFKIACMMMAQEMATK